MIWLIFLILLLTFETNKNGKIECINKIMQVFASQADKEIENIKCSKYPSSLFLKCLLK